MVHAGLHSSEYHCAGKYLAVDNWKAQVFTGIGKGRNFEALEPRLQFLLDEGVLSSVEPQTDRGGFLVELTPYSPTTDPRIMYGLTPYTNIDWLAVADGFQPPPIWRVTCT